MSLNGILLRGLGVDAACSGVPMTAKSTVVGKP